MTLAFGLTEQATFSEEAMIERLNIGDNTIATT